MTGGKRMDKKLKQALEAAYRAPEPVGKAAFLKRHRRRELGRWELVGIQIRYIRWWVWAASLALFGGILWMAAPVTGLGAWYAAAFTPFLALLAVMENGRAQVYQMEELELACRMALPGIVLTRMVVLGLFHLILLAGLTPPLAAWGGLAFARTGVYLLTPYLLTAALGMELARRVRGRGYLLACGGAAVLVSMLGVQLLNWPVISGQPEQFLLWVAALAASLIAVAVEVNLNFHERSELQWS